MNATVTPIKPNEVTKLRDALVEQLARAANAVRDLHARAVNAELGEATALAELENLGALAEAVIDSKRSDLERLVAAGVLANATIKARRIVEAMVVR